MKKSSSHKKKKKKSKSKDNTLDASSTVTTTIVVEENKDKDTSPPAASNVQQKSDNVPTPKTKVVNNASKKKKNERSTNNNNNSKSTTNNNDNDDPSKWSKSKKKRMRMKYSKSAKRQQHPDTKNPSPSTKEKNIVSKDNNSKKATTEVADVADNNNDEPKICKNQTITIVNTESSSTSTISHHDKVDVDKKEKKKKRKKHTTKDTDKDEEEDKTTAVSEVDYHQKNEVKKRKVDNVDQDDLTQHINSTTTTTARFAFKVDDTDHCETPLKSYQDIVDILDQLAHSLHKSRSSLIIYDPYYCNGGIKTKLASLGFTNVINNNSDFYNDISKKNIPHYDVLLTNPPYSGAHMGKLLGYCKQIAATSDGNNKPFLLLLPHYVYTKDYYQLMLGKEISSSMFYLVPMSRYNYVPPSWVEAEKGSKALTSGKQDTAPFPSFWYCHAGNINMTDDDSSSLIESNWLVDKFGSSGTVRPKHISKLRYAKCTKDIPRDFRGEFDPNNKRANPKARKRAAKLLAASR